MKTLKRYIQNKVRMKRSMAEGYALEEALGFRTNYLPNFTATRRRVWDDKEDLTMVDEVFEGGGLARLMDADIRRWLAQLMDEIWLIHLCFIM